MRSRTSPRRLNRERRTTQSSPASKITSVWGRRPYACRSRWGIVTCPFSVIFMVRKSNRYSLTTFQEGKGTPASPPSGGLQTGTAAPRAAKLRTADQAEARERLGTPTSGRHRGPRGPRNRVAPTTATAPREPSFPHEAAPGRLVAEHDPSCRHAQHPRLFPRTSGRQHSFLQHGRRRRSAAHGRARRHRLAALDPPGRGRSVPGANQGPFRVQARVQRNRSPVRRGARKPDLLFDTSDNRIEDVAIIHTPGHTNGSICFLYRSPHGKSYLFSGDTIFQWDGEWSTLVLPHSGGSAGDLARSLAKLQARSVRMS